MTINQIRYFIAAAKYDTFLEASESLNISQSSLSKSLQRLENELNIQLFDRSGRAAVLTKEGSLFFEGALNILTAYNETMSKLHNSIRIVTLPILSAYNLTGPLRIFSSDNKEINLIIDEMEDYQIRKELENETCDLAITRKECLEGDYFNYYPLDTDELILITSRNHPLASRGSVSLKELSNEHFILMNHYTSVYNICINACKNCSFTPYIVRTARIETIISAVEANEGISLLMRKNLHMFNCQNISIIPLTEKITSTVILAVNKKKKITPNIKSLIKFLTER